MSTKGECSSIGDGDYVIIQREKYMKLHKLNKNKSVVSMGKEQVDLCPVIGEQFWSTFKMCPSRKGKRLYTLNKVAEAKEFLEEMMAETSSGQDNRFILDDGRSQALSTEEIVGLREQGFGAQDIVSQLIENSCTFSQKTEYAQEKYLKKKQKKYFEYITIRKPTLRLIADILFGQDPIKVLNMRCDSLAHMLSLVNAYPGGSFLVYETGCQGLVVAGLVEAVGGQGKVVQVHPGSSPQRQAVLAMNFTASQLSVLFQLNFYLLLRKGQMPTSEEKNSTVVGKEENGELVSKDVTISTSNEDEKNGEVNNVSGPGGDVEINSSTEKVIPKEENKEDSVDNNSVASSKAKRKRDEVDSLTDDNVESKKPKVVATNRLSPDQLVEGSMDGLVVACREDPCSITKLLLNYVGPSRPVVIFSPYRELLVNAFQMLKSTGRVINVRMMEGWLRSYQVAPNRTHPDITMSSGGGYLLVGTVVLPPR